MELLGCDCTLLLRCSAHHSFRTIGSRQRWPQWLSAAWTAKKWKRATTRSVVCPKTVCNSMVGGGLEDALSSTQRGIRDTSATREGQRCWRVEINYECTKMLQGATIHPLASRTILAINKPYLQCKNQRHDDRGCVRAWETPDNSWDAC